MKSLVRDSSGNMASEASRIAVLSSISRSLATSVGKNSVLGGLKISAKVGVGVSSSRNRGLLVTGREVKRNGCSDRDSVGKRNNISDCSISGRSLSEAKVTDGLESCSLGVSSSSEGKSNSTEVGTICCDGVGKPSNRLVCSCTCILVEVESIVSD